MWDAIQKIPLNNDKGVTMVFPFGATFGRAHLTQSSQNALIPVQSHQTTS
jgi:hypothetical protein